MTDGTPSIGSAIAGYRLERKLGEGGMGAVFLARNPDLPRNDAVKVLSAELSQSSEFRARFIREADLASRLTHPNIVAVYRRGETPDGHLWIAMQFIDGTDADAALRAHQMTALRAVHVITEVGKALDYAHGHHVVHRDIKPANFLLSRDESSDRVLLADFGIARALDEVGLTATGSVMSTVAYAAPEVLAGASFDYRADLYSLGCSLFRLLTGKTPFWQEPGVPAVMLAHLQQPPPKVSTLVPDLPAALDDVIAVAMAKDPAQRYRSAGELAAAAAAALHGQSQTVVWQTSAALTGPALTPGATPWVTYPQTAPVQPRKRRRALAAVLGVALLAGATVTAVSMTRSDSETAPTNTASTAPALVPMADLPGLLPSAEGLRAALGSPVTVDPVIRGMGIDSNILDTQDCAGPWMSAQRAAFIGSGWQALALQASHADQAPAQPGVQPAAPVNTLIGVVSFPVARLAPKFFDSQRARWEQCAGRTITMTAGGAPWPNIFGEFKVIGDDMLTISHRVDGLNYTCGRAMTVRDNVAIDVAACNSAKPLEAAVTLAEQIAAKVPH